MSVSNEVFAELLTTEQVAAILGLKRNTLEIYRVKGKLALPFVKLGTGTRAPVRYKRSDVEAWLKANTFSSTSAYAK